jgi:hypothetical protein
LRDRRFRGREDGGQALPVVVTPRRSGCDDRPMREICGSQGWLARHRTSSVASMPKVQDRPAFARRLPAAAFAARDLAACQRACGGPDDGPGGPISSAIDGPSDEGPGRAADDDPHGSVRTAAADATLGITPGLAVIIAVVIGKGRCRGREGRDHRRGKDGQGKSAHQRKPFHGIAWIPGFIGQARAGINGRARAASERRRLALPAQIRIPSCGSALPDSEASYLA